MEGIEDIYRKYFTDVYRYLLKLTHDASLAEEITAECFFKAMNSMNTLKEETSVRVWLCSIARNLFYDRMRKEKHFDDLSDTGMIRIQDPSPSPEETVLAAEKRIAVDQAVSRLTEPYRRVLRLRYFLDLSFEEIGKQFGKTANWACVICHRAKQMLKKELKDYEE